MQDRIHRLHWLLSKRRHTGIHMDELLEELECSRATVKRCLAALRDQFGAPLEYHAERGYHYAGQGVFEFPGLWFSAEELSALLALEHIATQDPSGLLNESISPFRYKLERLLQHQGGGQADWRQRLRLIAGQNRKPGRHFATVAASLTQGVRLQIDYHARSGSEATETRRVVSPQRLVQYRGNWYLDAYCHLRSGLRSFAVERITRASLLADAAQMLAAAQLDQELGAGYGIFSGAATELAELHFAADAARWVADEVWHPAQQDRLEADGSLRRTLPFSRGEELIMDILRHGADVEVIAPTTLRQAVAAKVRQMAYRYKDID